MTKKDFSITILSTRSGMIVVEIGKEFLGLNIQVQGRGRLKMIYITGDCHSNFERLYAYPVEMWHEGKVHKIRPSVIHLMRGQVFLSQMIQSSNSRKKYWTRAGSRIVLIT